MNAFAAMETISALVVLVATRAGARQTDEYQLDHAVDNRSVKQFVVLIEREAVELNELAPSRVAKFLPDCRSVNDTIRACCLVMLRRGWSGVKSVSRRWWAEIVRQVFPFDSRHDLFGCATKARCEIQRLVRSQGKQRFFDHSGIPPGGTPLAAAHAQTALRSIVETMTKIGEAASANISIKR